jgi:hypothetical protein
LALWGVTVSTLQHRRPSVLLTVGGCLGVYAVCAVAFHSFVKPLLAKNQPLPAPVLQYSAAALAARAEVAKPSPVATGRPASTAVAAAPEAPAKVAPAAIPPMVPAAPAVAPTAALAPATAPTAALAPAATPETTADAAEKTPAVEPKKPARKRVAQPKEQPRNFSNFFSGGFNNDGRTNDVRPTPFFAMKGLPGLGRQ